MVLLVYVDDIVHASNHSAACKTFKAYLNDCFTIKDLRPLKYSFKIVDECGLSKHADFSIEENDKISFVSDNSLHDASMHHQVIDCPFISLLLQFKLIVHILSQSMQVPRSEHMEAIRLVLWYLKVWLAMIFC